MIQKTYTIDVKSSYENEMIDVTKEVQDLVLKSDVRTGQVVLFVPHTTAGVTINENTDPDVKRDMILAFNNVFIKDPNFRHYEGNSHAHIKSSVLGVDQTILIDECKLLLGVWQGVYFVEFDGPRKRQLMVRISGE